MKMDSKYQSVSNSNEIVYLIDFKVVMFHSYYLYLNNSTVSLN